MAVRGITLPHPISDEDGARIYVQRWADQLAMDRLDRFVGLLLEENQRQNLISNASEQLLWSRHLADSAQLLEHVPRETYQSGAPGPWLDLGSGAGLPGLIIAILRPEFSTILVESRARRAEFLNKCVSDLDLSGCEVVDQRLERITPFESWVISARAFAPLPKLLRLSAPFCTKETRYLLPKGRSAAHELERLKPSVRTMFHVEQSLTDPEAGIIVSA
jgi:16S rRNA (guanine527-N7)-methyltransferase